MKWLSRVFLGLLAVGLAGAGCIEDAAYPPEYGVFMGVMFVGEATGSVTHGPPFDMMNDKDVQDVMTKLEPQNAQFLQNAMTGLGPLMTGMMQQNTFYTRPFFIGPSVAQQADFIDANAPPFCMAFKWPAQQMMPALAMSDGGDLTFNLNGNGTIKATDTECISSAGVQVKGMMDLISVLQQGTLPPTPQPASGPGVCWQTWGLLAPVLDQATATKLALSHLDVGALPGQSACRRMPHPDSALKERGFYQYSCPYDPIIGLGSAQMAKDGGIAITDATTLDVTVAGGENIGPFSVEAIGPPKMVVPEDSFDLNQIDPRHTTIAAWKSTNADWVMVEIFAQVIPENTMPDPLTIFELLMEKDSAKQQALQQKLAVRPQPRQLAQVLCLEPASSKTKEIPSGALAVIPKPADGEVLVMMSTVMGLKMKQSAAGWGSYMVGLGRGSFGVSCRKSDNSQCTTLKSGLLDLLNQMVP